MIVHALHIFSTFSPLKERMTNSNAKTPSRRESTEEMTAWTIILPLFNINYYINIMFSINSFKIYPRPSTKTSKMVDGSPSRQRVI